MKSSDTPLVNLDSHYDYEADAGAIDLRVSGTPNADAKVHRTIGCPATVLVDVDEEGNPISIEIIGVVAATKKVLSS